MTRNAEFAKKLLMDTNITFGFINGYVIISYGDINYKDITSKKYISIPDDKSGYTAGDISKCNNSTAQFIDEEKLESYLDSGQLDKEELIRFLTIKDIMENIDEILEHIYLKKYSPIHKNINYHKAPSEQEIELDAKEKVLHELYTKLQMYETK